MLYQFMEKLNFLLHKNRLFARIICLNNRAKKRKRYLFTFTFLLTLIFASFIANVKIFFNSIFCP